MFAKHTSLGRTNTSLLYRNIRTSTRPLTHNAPLSFSVCFSTSYSHQRNSEKPSSLRRAWEALLSTFNTANTDSSSLSTAETSRLEGATPPNTNSPSSNSAISNFSHTGQSCNTITSGSGYSSPTRNPPLVVPSKEEKGTRPYFRIKLDRSVLIAADFNMYFKDPPNVDKLLNPKQQDKEITAFLQREPCRTVSSTPSSDSRLPYRKLCFTSMRVNQPRILLAARFLNEKLRTIAKLSVPDYAFRIPQGKSLIFVDLARELVSKFPTLFRGVTGHSLVSLYSTMVSKAQQLESFQASEASRRDPWRPTRMTHAAMDLLYIDRAINARLERLKGDGGGHVENEQWDNQPLDGHTDNQPLLDDEEEGKESEGCVERDEQLDAGIMERSPGRTSPIKSRFDDDNGLGNNSANIYYKFGPRTYSTENSGALSPALQYGQMDPRPAGSQQSETMHWEPQQEQSLRVQHFLEQTNQGGVLEECESLKDKTDISGISTVAIINMTGDQLKVMNAQVQTIQDLMSDVVGLKIVDVTRSQEIKNFSDLVAGLREEMDKLRERDTNKELLGEIAGLKKELAQLRDQDMKRELSDEIADLKKEVVQLKNQGVRRDDLDEMTSLKKEVAQLKGQGVRHAFDLRRMSREVDDKYAFFQDEMLKLVDK